MEPLVLQPDDGDRREFAGGECVIKAMPDQTGIGAFSVETYPAGFASPHHIHHRDDGVFYLLEGSLRIKCGPIDAVVGPGSMVYLPRGVPHAFRVEGDSPARWFNVQSPHGDFMLRAMNQTGAPQDPAQIELLGPPPF